MESNLENFFRDLKDDVSSYAELKFELLKLNTYERISKVIAIFSYGLLLMTITIITFLFFMLTLVYLINMWCDSTIAGYGIVTILYLILVILVMLNKKRICLKVINVILLTLNTTDKNNATTTIEPENNRPRQAADAN